MILVGIDPGVVTGYAIWKTQPAELLTVESWSILQAMKLVCSIKADVGLVIVEDARKRKGLYSKMDREQGKYGAGVREGVGSIKRDCGIWEEFLTSIGLPFEMRYPRNTKEDAEQFKRLTGWQGRTNEHSRDAAMIVFGMNEPIARAKVIAFRDAAARAAATRREDRPGRARPTVGRIDRPA